MTFEVVDASGVAIKGSVMIDDFHLLSFGNRSYEETAEIYRNVPNLKIRKDDVLICSYPKSGTNWGYEILSMLLNKKAELRPEMKIALMLELMPEEEVDKFPSPRVLNTHLPVSFLPKQMAEKGTKIVWILRNPKDVAVSLYHYIRGLTSFEYEGKFSDFLSLFMDGKLFYGSWFDYQHDYERAVEKNPDRFHLTYFEDLKENGIEEVKKLARFLSVEADEKLCSDIVDCCSFKSLLSEKQIAEPLKQILKNNFSLFRKGEIGDWKNYFTVAESEKFDKLFKEKMASSKLKFRFEPKN